MSLITMINLVTGKDQALDITFLKREKKNQVLKYSCMYCILSCNFCVLRVFQMVILDVVIIGGGPHALTLASLLSSPGETSSLSRTCTAPKSPVPNLEPSDTKPSSGRKKRRKATAGAT